MTHNPQEVSAREQLLKQLENQMLSAQEIDLIEKKLEIIKRFSD